MSASAHPARDIPSLHFLEREVYDTVRVQGLRWSDHRVRKKAKAIHRLFSELETPVKVYRWLAVGEHWSVKLDELDLERPGTHWSRRRRGAIDFAINNEGTAEGVLITGEASEDAIDWRWSVSAALARIEGSEEDELAMLDEGSRVKILKVQLLDSGGRIVKKLPLPNPENNPSRSEPIGRLPNVARLKSSLMRA